jgi:pimeloyl-ACP methyl ester carboxylesterase
MARDLLFVHGMWSHSSVWDHWLPHFEARGYRCKAVNLPGHHPETPSHVLAQVDFESCVRAVLDDVSALGRPVIIGHSLGGLVAQQVAARSDPSAVVLINSAAPRDVWPTYPVSIPGFVRHLRWGAWRRALALSRREANYLLWGELSPQQQEQLFARILPESGRLLFEVAFGRLHPSRAHHVDPRAVRCPLLALAGARDHIVPRPVSRGLAEYYGHRLAYREFPEHAHWILSEPGHPQRIAEILTWLESYEAAPARRS